MDKLGLVTDVDEQFVYVWSNALDLNELKFPVNPQNKIEPGDIVGYKQTRCIQEIQNVNDIMKETEHDELVNIQKSEKLKWKAKVYLTFAPDYTREYQLVINKTQHLENPVKAVAYAEDILCQVNTLIMVPSYAPHIKYEAGLAYIAYITRVPRTTKTPVAEVGSLFLVVGTNFIVEKNQSIANKILQKCPWYSLQNGTNATRIANGNFRTIFHDHDQSERYESIDWNTLQNEANVENAPPQKSAIKNANFQEKTFNNDEPPAVKSRMAIRTTFNNGFQSSESAQIHHQELTSFYNKEPFAEKCVPMGVPNEQLNENVGLIVRTDEEYSVLWSPIHDLVRVQFGYNEEENRRNEPIYRVGEWANYLCLEEFSTIHGGIHCSHTAYYIQKLRNASSPKEVFLIGNNVVAKLSLKSRQNHSRQYSMAKDDFFGNVLCSAEDILFGRQFNQQHSPVKVFAVYTEEYKYSKWVAFAYHNYQNNSSEKVIGLPESIINREIVEFMNSHGIGMMQPSTSQQSAEEERHSSLGQQMALTDKEKQYYRGEKSHKYEESTYTWKPSSFQYQPPSNNIFDEQNGDEEDEKEDEEGSMELTPDSVYEIFPRHFSPPSTAEILSDRKCWDSIVNTNQNGNAPTTIESSSSLQQQQENQQEGIVQIQQQSAPDPDAPLIVLDGFDDVLNLSFECNANNNNALVVQQEEEIAVETTETGKQHGMAEGLKKKTTLSEEEEQKQKTPEFESFFKDCVEKVKKELT